MIQRIQTVYLLLVVILAVLFITGKLFMYTGSAGDVNIIRPFIIENTAINKLPAGSDIMLNIITIGSIFVAIIAFITIFLYRKRKIQYMITVATAILALLMTFLTVYLLYLAYKSTGMEIIPNIRIALPPVIFVLLLLAARGIRNDEKLVRSYDRIR